MGTRCGDVDAGALEYLAKKEDLDIRQIVAILNQESGVLGISKNFSSDFRELKDAEIKYHEKAAWPGRYSHTGWPSTWQLCRCHERRGQHCLYGRNR